MQTNETVFKVTRKKNVTFKPFMYSHCTHCLYKQQLVNDLLLFLTPIRFRFKILECLLFTVNYFLVEVVEFWNFPIVYICTFFLWCFFLFFFFLFYLIINTRHIKMIFSIKNSVLHKNKTIRYWPCQTELCVSVSPLNIILG